MSNGWGASLINGIRSLLAEDQFLPPRSVARQYSYARYAFALLCVILLLVNAPGHLFASRQMVATAILFTIGVLVSIALQFAETPRRYVVTHAVGLLAAIVTALLGNDYPALILVPLLLSPTFYRFPLRQALLISALPFACYALVGVQEYERIAVSRPDPIPWLVIGGVLLFVLILSLVRRHQVILNQHLSWTKEQLDREMERAATLAIVQERARIARDMHDVLAHSLTVLSVQTQAARQTVLTEPQTTARILDEMADTLRQSMGESRQLVQALREATTSVSPATSLAEDLRAIGDDFKRRTGMQTVVLEDGKPGPVSEEIITALRYATREALTNAYRHGKAHRVTFVLRWESSRLVFSAQNDGAAAPATSSPGGGNGLRGMRERVSALRGTLDAGPLPDRAGYALQISLPYGQESRTIEGAAS